MTQDQPNASRVVNTLNLTVRSTVIDQPARKVRIAADAFAGLSDSSTQSGIPVTFFLDGVQVAELPTDDFGRVTLELAIDPLSSNGAVPSELSVRVRGSAAAASSRLRILIPATLAHAKYENEEGEQRDYGRYASTKNIEMIEVDLHLPLQRFVNIEKSEFLVTASDGSTQNVHADALGHIMVRFQNRWHHKQFFTNSRLDRDGPRDRRLNQVRSVTVAIVGFPAHYSWPIEVSTDIPSTAEEWYAAGVEDGRLGRDSRLGSLSRQGISNDNMKAYGKGYDEGKGSDEDDEWE